MIRSAAEGDLDTIEALASSGASVNGRDRNGETSLHHAYYHGQKAAIKLLRTLGADNTLCNTEGLTAEQMLEVSATEKQIDRLVDIMNTNGSWLSPELARPIYLELRETPEKVFNSALVRIIIREPLKCRRILCIAIKIGMSDSERRLGLALRGYGTKQMAEDFLNCGQATLRNYATEWARKRGMRIVSASGWGVDVAWGKF